jgi:hypothetical protein
MFEKMKARRKLTRHMAIHQGHVNIKGLCGYQPYSVTGAGETPYAVILSRGFYACPMIHFAGDRDYEPLRVLYRSAIKDGGYRGYHVSVNKV